MEMMPEQSAPQDRDWFTKEEAEAFIGTNSLYYLDKWETHSGSPLKGWNWAAAFFAIQWMAYRKMYVEAALYFIFAVLAAYLALQFLSASSWLISLVFGVLAGVLGNILYRYKALRIFRKTLNMGASGRLYVLRDKGGTSVLGVIISMVIQTAVFIAAYVILLTPAFSPS